MCKLSVLMTAFNREKYIGEAIESVLASTYTNYELIITDDASKDATLTIAREYEKKDNRIKVYTNDVNLGQFGNRNKAIEMAQGTYVKFLDSDDKIMPDGLELMVRAMQSFPEAGIGVPVKEIYTGNVPFLLNPHESIFQHYHGSNHLCYGPTGVIFKKDSLIKAGLFEVSYGILADTLLNIKIASVSPTVFFGKNLFFWRRHDDQVTVEQKDNVRMIRERFNILQAVMSFEALPLTQKEIAVIFKNFIKINTMHFWRDFSKGKLKNAFQIRKDTGLTPLKVLQALLNK